jgi:hypothetical protein
MANIARIPVIHLSSRHESGYAYGNYASTLRFQTDPTAESHNHKPSPKMEIIIVNNAVNLMVIKHG